MRAHFKSSSIKLGLGALAAGVIVATAPAAFAGDIYGGMGWNSKERGQIIDGTEKRQREAIENGRYSGQLTR
ncbi:MAG: hypothetical protein RL291_1260, partial [Pseudomonadota bacterium]